jgi:hypothetical protein
MGDRRCHRLENDGHVAAPAGQRQFLREPLDGALPELARRVRGAVEALADLRKWASSSCCHWRKRGTGANPATVTITPSNADGVWTDSGGRNASGLVAPGSLCSAEPFGSPVVGSDTLLGTAPLELPLRSSDSTGASPASASRWNHSSVVPEPSTAALLAFAATVCCLSTIGRKWLGALGR